MKGFFLSIGKSVETDFSGIGIKVKNQMKAFNNAGLQCEEYVMPLSNSPLFSLLYRLPFLNVYPIWKYNEVFNKIDYIYMRRPFVMNINMRMMLKEVRRHNPRIKIIVELPTYPYDEEYKTYKLHNLLLQKDKYNRTKMHGLIDRFAILTDESEVFGIPTIKIKNGIDIEQIKKRSPLRFDDETINICAVAMFKEWHGYERLINGVYEYYKKNGTRKFIFHFVGEGSELNTYRKLVEELSLSDHFAFYGFMNNKDLDMIYDKCRLALGTFGMYKKNIDLSCDLKSREAVARGIPMVTGCKTDIFIKEKYSYFYEFPNDSSILDIQKIVEFYDSIYQFRDEATVIDEIRDYAKKNIGMDDAMKNVIDYFSM